VLIESKRGKIKTLYKIKYLLQIQSIVDNFSNELKHLHADFYRRRAKFYDKKIYNLHIKCLILARQRPMVQNPLSLTI